MTSRNQDVTKAPLRRGLRVFSATVAVVALAGCGSEEGSTTATTDGAPTAPAEGDVIATVEGVEGGEITGADLEEEVLAEAEATGTTPPAAESPDFQLVAGSALDQLILERWIAGDVAEQGGEVTEQDAEALANRIDASGVEELQVTWGPRTECLGDVSGRLCAAGATGSDDPQPPPDIPPASGLEEPPG